jgi:uncharacterized protein (TIGR02246 family)
MRRPNAVAASPTLALLLLVVALSNGYAQRAGRGDVNAVVRRIITAANRVNLEGVLAEFSPNAEMFDNGMRYANMSDVRAAYAPVFRGLRSQDIRVEKSSTVMASPTLAVYTASGTFTATDTSGAVSPRRGFAWTFVFDNADGTWKAVSAHQSITEAPPPTSISTTRDMIAFRRLVAAHAAAVNRRDARGVASTFTPDADQIIVNGPRANGRDAIRDATQNELSRWPAGRRFTLTMTGARMLTPDIAVIETDATFSEGLPPNRGTMVVVRRGNDWLISSLRVYPAVGAGGR